MRFSDQDLAGEIRSGSAVAFERLMRRHERLVYRIAIGFTRDREAALDVTQETFLKVHGRLDGWRGEGELKSWIAKIAAREAMNWQRSARRRPTCELNEDALPKADPHLEKEWVARGVRDALHRSLSALSSRQRLAVVLRYYQGMSAREIAGVLVCSEGTARNILFRSLRKLRATLSRYQEAVP